MLSEPEVESGKSRQKGYTHTQITIYWNERRKGRQKITLTHTDAHTHTHKHTDKHTLSHIHTDNIGWTDNKHFTNERDAAHAH